MSLPADLVGTGCVGLLALIGVRTTTALPRRAFAFTSQRLAHQFNPAAS